MSDVQNTISELLKSAQHGAEALGKAVQTTAPQAWNCLVYQVKLEAWTSMIGWGIVSLLLFVASFLLGRAKCEDNFDREYQIVGTIILSVVGFLVLLGNLGSNIPDLLNPQYAAAVKLFGMIRG